ncbi:hypothetical protein D3C81_1518940 [compost metagenome]
MKADQAAMAVDSRVQRSDVAVADQRLGVAPDKVEVELIEQAHAAIATAHAQDRVNGRVSEGIVQIL